MFDIDNNNSVTYYSIIYSVSATTNFLNQTDSTKTSNFL